MRSWTQVPARIGQRHTTTHFSYDTEHPTVCGFSTEPGDPQHQIFLSHLLQGMESEVRGASLLIWPVGAEIVMQILDATFVFPRHRLETFIAVVMQRIMPIPADLSKEAVA